MSTTIFSYKVILKDHGTDPSADSFGDIDITKRVNVLELIDGYPISATITLDARDGKFLANSPIITQWDRIYLEIVDEFGIKYSTVVHVTKFKKQRTEGKGLQLKLICPHQSSNLIIGFSDE